MTSPEPLTLSPLSGVAEPLQLFTHDPDLDLVSAVMHREGAWEPFESELLVACLTPGAIVVDVGANLGYFSLLLAQAEVPVQQVFAFEPAAANYELLQRNIALNDCGERVTAIHAALGTADGDAVLHLSEDNLGDHQLVPSETGRQTEPVRILAGDAYFAGRMERADVVKIDTQGTEAAVVSGLWQLLQRSRPALQMLIELTPFALRHAGSTGRALVELLAELALPLAIVDHENRRVVPESAEALCRWCDNVDSTPQDQGFMNIFVGEIPPAFRRDGT